jgi:hypothetical protein
MIALRVVESIESLDAAVARAQHAARTTQAVWLDAVVTHIHELAAQAEAMEAMARKIAAKVPGSPDVFDSLGEGGEDLELVGWDLMDAHRYAQEAAYWLTVYRLAQERMAAGKPALTWQDDAAVEVLRKQVEVTREAMRAAM